jgi:hypothetical protein
MKLRKLVLTLTMAALLPTFAYASDNTDAISASFDRDLYHESSVSYLPATVKSADPLNVINVTLLSESDPVLASFERDIYSKPVAFKNLLASGDADPLDMINATLRCENTGTINASITSNLNHC